jgi:hypothetical protein
VRPDLDNPDRIRTVRSADGQTRRWPQLRLFASLGKVQEVQLLLRAGANVDLLDASGGSALLRAIQSAQQTGDRRVLDLLLSKIHASTTLDSITARKRLSLLISAIDFGEYDVVERLLAMGATPDLRGNVMDNTPLYHLMGLLAAVGQPAKVEDYLRRAMTAKPDLMQKDTLRRHGVGHAGTFGSGNVLEAIHANERLRKIFEKAIEVTVDVEYKRHTVTNLMRIVELLLQYGANPNAVHDYPAAGRTPLMLAAENNDALAFDIMLRHHGDPYLIDVSGHSCITIATAFKSGQILALLRDKGIL